MSTRGLMLQSLASHMPVILRVKGYKFWFYEADLDEPAHIHAGREDREAKFWLTPVSMARPGRMKAIELREVERIIKDNIGFILDIWDQEQKRRANR